MILTELQVSLHGLEGSDGQSLPPGVTVRVDTLKQTEHVGRLDVINEVILPDLEVIRYFFTMNQLNLSVLVSDGLDRLDVLLSEGHAVLLAHGDVLRDGDGAVPASVRLVKQLTES